MENSFIDKEIMQSLEKLQNSNNRTDVNIGYTELLKILAQQLLNFPCFYYSSY